MPKDREASYFREATVDDVPSIIRLLADDELGQTREGGKDDDDGAYRSAFEEIDQDQRNQLIVAEVDGSVVGCMQLTLIPNMTFCGGTRLQIEGVRIDQAFRSMNLGGDMLRWAIDFGRAHDCRLVQLTTNKARKEAQRFYENAGFEPSHIGYKYELP